MKQLNLNTISFKNIWITQRVCVCVCVCVCDLCVTVGNKLIVISLKPNNPQTQY